MNDLLPNKELIKTSHFTYIYSSEKSQTAYLIANAVSKKSIEGDELIIKILDFLNDYRLIEEVYNYCIQELNVLKEDVNELLDYLKVNKFIVEQGDIKEEKAMRWIENNWGNSLLYHEFTYDYPVLDYSTAEAYIRDQDAMKEYKKIEEEPSIYKTFENYIKEIILPPPPPIDMSYEDSLVNISSCNNNINLYKLSSILYYTYGEVNKIKFPVTQPLLRRTSPSGGARHPSECYLVIFNIEGLEAGLYHYSVKNHSLIYLKKGDFREFCNKNCYGLVDYKEDPKVVFLHTSIFERNWWRYREPKTYKVIFYDFGHILYNFRIVTNSLELSTYTIGSGLNDSKIEEFLNIDGFIEGIIYYTAI